jgi:4-hydroxybenzoate polyprenyltransferase
MALGFGVLLFLGLCLVGTVLPRPSWWLIGGYLGMNVAYSLGLKRHLGLREILVAMGFWLRLKTGAEPVTHVILTPWAAIFTLGLAYFLGAMKGFGSIPSSQWPRRWAMGLGAGLSGALALVALTSLTLKRAADGQMAYPEFPPMFCLLGMHRFAHHSCQPENQREQASAIFKDPIILAAIALFAIFLL